MKNLKSQTAVHQSVLCLEKREIKFRIESKHIHSFPIGMTIGNTVSLRGGGLLVCLEIEVYEETQVTRK